jgi:natural product biosynthesis luciferase-like monooxygenase protein
VHGAHQLIEQQAVRTPQQPAVSCAGHTLTFAQLNSRANRLARRLAGLGVGPDRRVGVMLPRGTEMVVALLAIHKAGGAYVPLDPDYPPERLAQIAEDSGMGVVLALEEQRPRLPRCTAQVMLLDRERSAIERESDAPFDGGAGPHHLAYVIYTSGSTGKPKGVQIEHRNVVNFFAGMSDLLPAGGADTWLAVTSLNFDISVLELLWTLAQGCHVVVAEADNLLANAGATAAPAPRRKLDFSLFYFSADESTLGSSKYKLLLDGARFADEHGFAAVWTPERHFHAFGGLYPNPAVIGAALATVTSRVQIRAGSVVAPLHHPIRIAEDWSVVDNLSGGRVGVSFASGWHPNDFVLNPAHHADAKGVMLRHIDAARRLWRGEKMVFEGPKGAVELGILPRPVQAELPFWVTSAGNVETFKDAGRVGANLLTHLLGQSLEELRPKIEAFRAARREAGHKGPGLVSLMVHTFVGADAEEVREWVREPLIAYLKTSFNLVKQYADSFPVFRRRRAEGGAVEADLTKLSEADMRALLEHSFERYFETSGLFGTPQSCQPMLRAMADAGVDDVACLIDFGVDSQRVLEHLPYLARARALAAAAEPESLPSLMRRHAVTHLQCTPSLARVLLGTEAGRSGLAALRAMLVGGEALPPVLARELKRALGQGTLLNMYGPTETTVWSTAQAVDEVDGTVPIGTPLANQSVYVLDRRGQPLPAGCAGELVIGGDGVTRGYLDRPELTAERFVADRFSERPGSRMYRTGDLARIGEGGRIEFLGRLDDQVKIRGHRIELGEIEEALRAERDVHDAAVTAPEVAGGDRQLIGYAVAKPGRTLQTTALRDAIAKRLPAVMVPAQIVVLPALPRTPNGKLDRNALPRPDPASAGAPDAEAAAAATPMESALASMWAALLGRPQVGIHEDFVGLGGHSLLAVQMQIKLADEMGVDVALADIFRHPTIHRLAKRVQQLRQDPLAEV